MAIDDSDDFYEKLGIALAGGAVGLAVGYAACEWWQRRKSAEAKRSRIELTMPALVQQVCSAVGPLLGRMVIRKRLDHEDAYRDRLHRFLLRKLSFVVERTPHTPVGAPDILVHAALALEVKRAMSKDDMDRCVGQCSEYAKLWPTWIILFDTPPSQVQRLAEKLADNGLGHLPIIPYLDSERPYLP
jgi:hypothetical protein